MYDKILSNFNIKSLEQEKRIAVAVSGGIDSLSLILLANTWAKNHKIKIIGITVDHCLRKKSADEAKYISKLLKSHKIEHHILKWEGKKPTSNIEAIAREKRYELLTEFCRENKINTLLVGHHLQDQAETFLIRLFRGSGIDGLASMKNYKKINGVAIIRPFLKINKEDLRQYLVDNEIQWIEDESNEDERFLRNKIRKFLNSLEDKKNILKRVDFAIGEIAKAKDIISEKSQKIKKEILKFDVRGFYKADLLKFTELEEDFALRILANCLMEVSGNPYKPRLEKLKRLYEKILNGFKKETFYGCVIKLVDGKDFYIYREYSAIKDDIKPIFGKEIIWDNRFKISLNKPIKDFKIGHIKKGEFNKLLAELKNLDYKKYKEFKNLKGIEKEVIYTLPILRSTKDNKIKMDVNLFK